MSPLEQLNWENVRVFITLTRSSSLREAAERLGLTHPTVRKRLDTLEASLSLKLFHRRPKGLHLTVQGQELRDAANEVEEAMQGLSRRARAVDPELHGPVRVTMPANLAEMLTPAMAEFSRQWPQAPVVLDTGNEFADLGSTSVDVAVRILRKGRKPEGFLAGRKAVSGGANAVYGDLGSGRWIGVGLTPPQTGWTATSDFDHLPIGPVIPTATVRREACKHGMGIAMLPCVMVDSELARLTDPNEAFDVWVLVHPALRENPRLRLFRDVMVDALSSMEGAMQGRR